MVAAVSNEVRWRVVGFRESTFQAAPGAPIVAGSSCEKCGQSIRYVVSVESSLGEKLNVGRDCAVTLEGGIELRELRNAEAAYEREMYLASPEYAAKVAREKAEKLAREERAAKAETEHACLLLALRMIARAPASSKYERDMAALEVARIEKGIEPEFDEKDAATMALAFAKASLPASKHTGTVGKRLEVSALFEAMITIDGIYGTSYLRKFRTAEGEVLAWFSGSCPDGLWRKDLGNWVKIRGTVKAHKDYNGEAQTSLTRIKVLG